VKPLTARELLIWLALVVGFFAYLRWDARRDGRLAEKLAQNAQHVTALQDSLKVARATFTVDTVRTFKRITNTVTQLDTLIQSDTLRLTDTVKVTVEVVREAVETLNACRQTVLDCGRLRALEQRRGDSLQARVDLQDKQKPKLLDRCGLSVGYGSTAKGLGPAVLVGCRVAP